MQLAAAVHNFEPERIRSESGVLVAVQNCIRPLTQLKVLGCWSLQHYFDHPATKWRAGHNMFLHPQVPQDFFPRYRAAVIKHGFSSMFQRAAQRRAIPFTIAEAEAADRASGNDMWVYDFMRGFNYRDGLYCVHGQWAFLYVSDRLLALTKKQRISLMVAAIASINRIEEMTTRRRPRKPVDNFGLTERELEVLQQRALLGSAAAAAKKLKLSVKAVEFHLANARQKLGFKDTAQALLRAHKHGLIHIPE